MIQLTVFYGHPQDPAAFDRHYREAHVPLAQQLPGLEGFLSTRLTSLAPQEPSPYYLMAHLYFAHMGALQAALQSPEGRATGDDWLQFATGGVALVVGEVEVYRRLSFR